MAEKTEQQAIDDYRRVEAFLADPAVKAAIKAVRDGIYVEFQAAQSSVQMEMAWAKSKAMTAIEDELLRTMAQGQVALKARERREEQEKRTKRK